MIKWKEKISTTDICTEQTCSILILVEGHTFISSALETCCMKYEEILGHHSRN